MAEFIHDIELEHGITIRCTAKVTPDGVGSYDAEIVDMEVVDFDPDDASITYDIAEAYEDDAADLVGNNMRDWGLV